MTKEIAMLKEENEKIKEEIKEDVERLKTENTHLKISFALP